MATRFAIGDTVQLQSGGPSMTIAALEDDDGKLLCTWFSRAQQKRAYFDPRLLISVEITGVPIAVYFTCAAGTRYRVRDTTFSGGKHHPRPVGDPTATSRVFVPNGGIKRSYTFKPKDSRVLEEQALERQLRESSYLPTEPFDTSTLTPGARPR